MLWILFELLFDKGTCLFEFGLLFGREVAKGRLILLEQIQSVVGLLTGTGK